MPTKRKSDGEAYFTDAAGSTNSQRAAASGLRDVTSWSKMMLTVLAACGAGCLVLCWQTTPVFCA